jgi:hypothetical protein
MVELYVIVHEYVAKSDADFGIKSARSAYAELLKLKSSASCLDISRGQDPSILHPEMPRITSDLSVLVVGANKWCCCSLQLYALRKKGYSAKFYDLACYDGEQGEGRPKHLFENVADAPNVIPEFFKNNVEFDLR